MSAPRPESPVDLDDIQGLLRFGYKHHSQACFLLLRVKDPAAARAWLATAPVTSAAPTEPPPATVLQIALGSAGLRALGVPAATVAQFSAEFLSGMGSDANRARRLGDVGSNAPSHWRWGHGADSPHLLLLLYALPGQLEDWQRTVEAQCSAGFDILQRLLCSTRGEREPFGFVDGISQPLLDWSRERPVRDAEQLKYSNLSCLGEFLLGYPNEYGGYTDRPLLSPQHDPQALLPRAEDQPTQADLGRNGSYLVLRQLEQDVQGFWHYLQAQVGDDMAQQQRLAAAMLGRRLDGQPLLPCMPADDPNAFDFQSDPRGSQCPLGAHIRRANPRNADLPAGEAGLLPWLTRILGFDAPALEQDRVASTRFHRLLRRGRAYGQDGTAGATPAGLHFICLGANIARQFEFVQGAWLNSPHFDGLREENDPLLGNREPGQGAGRVDGFSLPQAQGPDQRLAGLPQFVTVRGGAYFFLPGIRALRYLARIGDTP